MQGIRKVARAYYDRASKEEKYRAKQFFESLDVDGDGKVSLSEFKASAHSWYSDENFFKQLDENGDGTLDFREALSLYYIEKVRIPKCDGCRAFLVEPYFSCLSCQENTPNTFDLCCSCYKQGKVQHQHPLSNFQDNHSLFKLFRKCTIDAQTTQEKKGMDELHKIAKSHYRAGSPEVQALAHKFFNSLDTDGDGKVDLPEFLAFMRQEGYAHMRNPHFFKELDRDCSGTLDFWERGVRIAKAGSPIPSNAIVPASSTNLYVNNNGKTYNTYVVHPPTAKPSTSNAIVPASKTNKWKAALKAFEMSLGIGSISTTLCSIL